MPEAISPMAFLRDLQRLLVVDPIDMSVRAAPGVILSAADLRVGEGSSTVLLTALADGKLQLGSTAFSEIAIVFTEVGNARWAIGNAASPNNAFAIATGDDVDSSQVLTILANVFTVTGDINPEADGTRDLGIQTTAQWANLWSDLVNGADYGFDNGWRMLEADTYQGYGPGIAFDFGLHFETGKALSVRHVNHRDEEQDVLDDDGNVVGTRTVHLSDRERVIDRPEKPKFVVTEDFIEYQGRRITPEILDKLLALVS